jgi:ABC-type transport system involved in multi-copper enzyme maturation permease subunit
VRSVVAFRRWLWLADKEYRELVASRAWWFMLLAIGPLVGVSFISAVRTYGEASGLNGTAVGVGEAFSPLVGVWAPTFSACEIAAAFLLPFVGIRLVSGDRQSGALKIELQHPMSPFARMLAKAVVLLLGWIVAMAIPATAIVLWATYGGSIYIPEIATIVVGHLLNAGLTIALAAATASVTEHPSTAAILTLAVTVGTWILNFIAAVQGGVWERAAGYTPTAMVAEFQHGLIRLDVVLVAVTLIATGLLLAAIWMRLGAPVRERAYDSAALGALTVAAILASTLITPSWDTSENRANSFPRADERALAQIASPLNVEVHLAPEDPRRVDLDRRALSKLRRVMPHVHVKYVSATTIGLFEQTSPHYGEIWYELDGKRAMSRATTAESVLENVYALSGVTPRADSDDAEFRGHPLAAPPRGAGVIFYGIWPALVVAGGFFLKRRHG